MQLQNIFSNDITLSVFKFDIFKDFKEEHIENISFISVTEDVSKFVISISVISVQL